METVRGIVTRVLSEDEDRGRTFLAVEYEGATGALVQAKMGAYARGVRIGDAFQAEGEWRAATYKGRTEENFEARQFRPDLPRTRPGAERFLLSIFSERAHGVSPAAVAHFLDANGGAAALRAAADRPEVLLSLTSDALRFREPLIREWDARTGGTRAVGLLQEAGLEEQIIDRIVGALRDRAFGIMRENPYVAAPIPRVGFGNADRVGLHMGVARDDRRRLLAAVEEVLRAQEADGSTAADIPTLLGGLQKVSGINAASLARFLEETSRSGSDRIAIHALPGGLPLCASTRLYAAEVEIVHGVVKLLKAGRSNPEATVKAAADELFARPEFSRFDAVQRLAVRMGATEPLSIITGGPGTGKSTVMAAVAELCDKVDGGPLFLVAPTGRAAKRLAATTKRRTSTVHRLLKAKGRTAEAQTFGMHAGNPLPARCTVVVDEASMMDAEMMAALISAMPLDGRIVMVGDRDQLPSVGPGAVLADLLFAENGGRAVVPSCMLVEVYRQAKDSGIATGAALVRDGQLPELGPEDRAGVSFRALSPAAILDEVERIVCKELPKLGLDPLRDVAVLCPMTKGPGGTWELNRRLSSHLNPNGAALPGVSRGPDERTDMPVPRMGDRVMLTENDAEADVMNGDVGTIVGSGKTAAGRPTIRVRFDDGPEVEFPAGQWRKLILAFAGTVHKSQGSQYKAVIMPVLTSQARMLDRTLLYTGWTRAERRLILLGEREALETAVATWRGDDRLTLLRRFISGVSTAALRADQRIDWRVLARAAQAEVARARGTTPKPEAPPRPLPKVREQAPAQLPVAQPAAARAAPGVPRGLFGTLGPLRPAAAAVAPPAGPRADARPEPQPRGIGAGPFGRMAARPPVHQNQKPAAPEADQRAAAARPNAAPAPVRLKLGVGGPFGGIRQLGARPSVPAFEGAKPVREAPPPTAPVPPAMPTAGTEVRRGLGGPFAGLGRRTAPAVAEADEDGPLAVRSAR